MANTYRPFGRRIKIHHFHLEYRADHMIEEQLRCSTVSPVLIYNAQGAQCGNPRC
jgi:hypothetical protein